MVKVAIISAGYKKEDLSKKFIAHLKETLKLCKAEADIYFIHAVDEYDTVFRQFGEDFSDTVINKSFSNSMNSGIRIALNREGVYKFEYDYFLVIGNDGFPQTEGWLDKLIATQEKTGAWITCPEHDNPHITAYNRHLVTAEGNIRYYKMFPAVCWLIAGPALREIGLFDEQFEVGCYEDDDYAERVVRAGGHIVVDTDVKLHHLLSQTFGQFNGAHIMGVNLQKFKNKYGVK